MVSKRNRNSGKRYVPKEGKIVNGKEFSNVICKCKMKCNDKISTDERKSMFDMFWNMADFCKQNAFICGLVQKYEVQRRCPRKEVREVF